jgi:hypothetical protein
MGYKFIKTRFHWIQYLGTGAYEAAGVSSQANTWAQRAQNVIASYVVEPAFIGCINPAVNTPNIPCFKSPLLPIMPDKNPTA